MPTFTSVDFAVPHIIGEMASRSLNSSSFDTGNIDGKSMRFRPVKIFLSLCPELCMEAERDGRQWKPG